MWVDPGLVTLIGFFFLGYAAMRMVRSDRPGMFIGLMIGMAFWFTADVMASSWMCLADLFIMAYAVHQRFPPKPVGQPTPKDVE